MFPNGKPLGLAPRHSTYYPKDLRSCNSRKEGYRVQIKKKEKKRKIKKYVPLRNNNADSKITWWLLLVELLINICAIGVLTGIFL